MIKIKDSFWFWETNTQKVLGAISSLATNCSYDLKKKKFSVCVSPPPRKTWLQFPLLKKEITSEVLKQTGDEEYNKTKQTQAMQLYIHLGGCTEICRRLMGIK